MITYQVLLDELKKEVGPIAKLFLDKAMSSLGITEINNTNYQDVLEVLKMNKELRDYISEVEKKLEKLK
ncbi:MAG: hypothetical protein NZ872_01320 [Archaeoglobaceae archaeon]|nr:hypothetical protein [Archaeoglobaceae archaeon]MDW8127838.1 hypothetical protein [Archaeoglobaceae archaeon]